MKLLYLFIAVYNLQAFAYDCSIFKEELPVLAGGRVKPYLVLSQESLKFMTGKSKYNDQKATQTFCEIMQGKLGDLPLLVEHVDSQKFVDTKTKFAKASDLLAKKMEIRAEIVGMKENNSYKKDLTKVFARITTFEKIQNGTSLQIYTGPTTQTDNINPTHWKHISEVLNAENLESIIEKSKADYMKSHGDRFLLELSFAKAHLFSYALLLSLVAIFMVVLMKKVKAPLIVTAISIAIQLIGITMRVMISGRAPITNMYETVMFSGLGALIISLGIYFFRKDKIFILAGLGYNILCLFMMMFANNMLSSSISPLVPVLRDNFWLSTHVTTIILSYAALALSWMAANITLYKLVRKTLTKKDYRYYQDLIYTCIKVGIVLLSAGIILGGVWADYSWGRFWGWDPKETWSLIVLLFYMALVHGKYSNWVTTHRFVLASAAGFMTVMMAWFGVNYILASGLHSYGFSEGGALFLGSFFILQIVYLIFCALKADFKPKDA